MCNALACAHLVLLDQLLVGAVLHFDDLEFTLVLLWSEKSATLIQIEQA